MEKPFTSVHFENRGAWREWLMANHSITNEIWVIYFKKHTGKTSIVYREALEEALCFGWIDGMIKRIDEEQYMQRFTPRRDKSNWSDTNIRLALKLKGEGKMHESGLKFQSRWKFFPKDKDEKNANFVLPLEIEAALREFPEAYSNFNNLPPSCRNQYVLWIMDAKKDETRARRIAESISLLEKGKKLGMK
jgi:uncharacterized protein YdeI (YjbR/CyaY-like superfamily)